MHGTYISTVHSIGPVAHRLYLSTRTLVLLSLVLCPPLLVSAVGNSNNNNPHQPADPALIHQQEHSDATAQEIRGSNGGSNNENHYGNGNRNGNGNGNGNGTPGPPPWVLDRWKKLEADRLARYKLKYDRPVYLFPDQELEQLMRDAVADSVLTALPASVLAAIPAAEEGPSKRRRLLYYLSQKIPYEGIEQHGYSKRDWERWDSFDITRRGLGDGSISVKRKQVDYSGPPYSSFVRNTKSRVDWKFQSDFLKLSYTWFWTFDLGDFDIVYEMKANNNFMADMIAMNVSFWLNTAYNGYRMQTKATLRGNITFLNPQMSDADLTAAVDAAFDDQDINWAALDNFPGASGTINWIDQLLQDYIHDQQSLTHTLITPNGGGPAFDSFGLFAFDSAYGVGYNQGGNFFRTFTQEMLMGHYLQLLPSSTIRLIRTSTQAHLSALYQIYLLNGIYEQMSGTQWLLRIAGFSTSAFVLLRSENELRIRGEWNDTSDGVQYLNRTNGQWSNADLLSFTTTYLNSYVTRMNTAGWMEFLSAYIGYSLEICTVCLQHAPNQDIYNMWEQIYETIGYDLLLNFQPSSGSLSGPATRSYTLFSGTHNMHDVYDLPLFLSPSLSPSCLDPTAPPVYNTSGNMQTIPGPTSQATCASTTPFMMPPASNEGAIYYRTAYHVEQQAGSGIGMPLDLLEKVVLQSPLRIVEERFSTIIGQERYNFITPYFELGHAGEARYASGNQIVACARLYGPHVDGAPVYSTQLGPSYNTQYIRLMSENHNTPFLRNWIFGVAGEGQALQSRQISVQHQGWLVTSDLLGPTDDMQASDVFNNVWNTNIILPLHVDAILVNNVTPLPMITNTSIAMSIPLNATFLIRHLNASVVMRVLLAERSKSSKITDVKSVSSSSSTISFASGAQPYSLMWLVDPDSTLSGVGRLCIVHKHGLGLDTNMSFFRTVILWGTGKTTSDFDRQKLMEVAQNATWTQTIVNSPKWNATQFATNYNTWQPYNTLDPIAQSQWNITVNMPLSVTLRISRTDVYQPWGFASVYSDPITGPLNAPPMWRKDVSRTVNGRPILSFAPGETPFRYRAIQDWEWYQPHLRPYAWIYSDWTTACSKNCAGGQLFRTVSCMNTTANTVISSQLCTDWLGPSEPTNVKCNTQPCNKKDADVEDIDGTFETSDAVCYLYFSVSHLSISLLTLLSMLASYLFSL